MVCCKLPVSKKLTICLDSHQHKVTQNIINMKTSQQRERRQGDRERATYCFQGLRNALMLKWKTMETILPFNWSKWILKKLCLWNEGLIEGNTNQESAYWVNKPFYKTWNPAERFLSRQTFRWNADMWVYIPILKAIWIHFLRFKILGTENKNFLICISLISNWHFTLIKFRRCV